MKNRLVGTLFVTALAVIFLPPILEHPKDYSSVTIGGIPSLPFGEQSFTPHLLPVADEEPLIPPRPFKQEEKSAAVATTTVDLAPPEATPEPQQPAQDLTSWVINMGSFTSAKKVDKLKKDLRKKAFPAFVTLNQTGNTSVILLQIGPILNKANAERMAADIAKQFNITGQVVQYP